MNSSQSTIIHLIISLYVQSITVLKSALRWFFAKIDYRTIVVTLSRILTSWFVTIEYGDIEPGIINLWIISTLMEWFWSIRLSLPTTLLKRRIHGQMILLSRRLQHQRRAFNVL